MLAPYPVPAQEIVLLEHEAPLLVGRHNTLRSRMRLPVLFTQRLIASSSGRSL